MFSALGWCRRVAPLGREQIGRYLSSCSSAQPVPSLSKKGRLWADGHAYGLLLFQSCSHCEIKELLISSRLPAHTSHCFIPSLRNLSVFCSQSAEVTGWVFPSCVSRAYSQQCRVQIPEEFTCLHILHPLRSLIVLEGNPLINCKMLLQECDCPATKPEAMCLQVLHCLD